MGNFRVLEILSPNFIFEKLSQEIEYEYVFSHDEDYYRLKYFFNNLSKIPTDKESIDKYFLQTLMKPLYFTSPPWLKRVYPEGTWWTYILYCVDGTLYTGITNNVYNRLEKHNKGQGAKYTRTRTPVFLVYQENHSNRSEASKKEYALKQLTRFEKIKLILEFREDTLSFYDNYLLSEHRLKLKEILK